MVRLTHAHAADTRPFSRIGRGLGTRLSKVPVNDIYVSAPARQINRMQAGGYSLSLCHYLLTSSLPIMAPPTCCPGPYQRRITPKTFMKGALAKFSKEELFFSAIGSVPCS